MSVRAIIGRWLVTAVAVLAALWFGFSAARRARLAQQHADESERLAVLRGHIADAETRHALRTEHELLAAAHSIAARRIAREADDTLAALTDAGHPAVAETIRRWRDA